MDGHGRALTDQSRGHILGRVGNELRHEGDAMGNSAHTQQQATASRSSLQPPLSHHEHYQVEPSLAHCTHQELLPQFNQEGFAMTSFNNGSVPGIVNSAATTPYIFYQQPLHPAAPYVFYHGPMPVPYYPAVPYNQPDMVPYSPSPQEQGELAPFQLIQPQGEQGQYFQPPAVPSVPSSTPLWQAGDPPMQQQYCMYQQQPQLVPLTYLGAPSAHFDPMLAAAEQVPQQRMENKGQVNVLKYSSIMKIIHAETIGVVKIDLESGYDRSWCLMLSIVLEF